MNEELRLKIQRLVDQEPDKYGKIFDIFPAETSSYLNFSAPAFIVDCYSDKIFQEVTRYKKEFILIIRNGRVTSLLAEIFLLNHACATGYNPLSREEPLGFSRLVAKKFIGAGMNGITESEMAATLFLESMIIGQDDWVSLHNFREETASLRLAYDHFTRVATEFIFHHEIGHEFVLDDRFKKLIDEYLDGFLASLEGLPQNLLRNVRTEIFADLFSIHVIFVKYSKTFNEKTMKNICKIVFCTVIIAILLNGMTHNLHKKNNDKDHIAVDYSVETKMAMIRLEAVTKYISEFVFDEKRTILCNADGFNYEIGFEEALIQSFADDANILSKVSEGTRGILRVLAQIMIGKPGQFTNFIDTTRVHRQIGKDPVAEKFIRDELGKIKEVTKLTQ